MPSALGTKKYITYFFCDRFVLRPLPALRKIWAHDMRSPAHLKRKNKTGQETCVCPMTYDIFRSRDIHKYVITYTLATLKSCACTCVGSKPRSCHLLNVWGKKKKIFPCHLTPNTISRSWLFTRSHSFSCPEIQLPGHVAPNAQANLGALQVESVAASHTSSAVVHLLSDISQSRHKKSGC